MDEMPNELPNLVKRAIENTKNSRDIRQKAKALAKIRKRVPGPKKVRKPKDIAEGAIRNTPVGKRVVALVDGDFAGLTWDQRRFVEELIVDNNIERAANRAGLEVNTCKMWSLEPVVIKAVQAYRSRLSMVAFRNAQDVVSELIKLGFSNMLDYLRVDEEGFAMVDIRGISRDQGAAIQEVVIDELKEGGRRVRIKLCDKRQALVDIGKAFGMFPTKVELSGQFGGPIQVEAVRTDTTVEEAARIYRDSLIKGVN